MKPGEYMRAAQRDQHPWWHPLAEPPKPKKSRKKVPTKIQTLIFSKKVFKKSQAKAWAKSHGFKSSGVDETATSYRIRQREPSAFKSGSLKTIEITDGVKAVIGQLRKE